MKCPNCGKESSDTATLCKYCGYSLYGPKSINLNNVSYNIDNNNQNIESITGIDINSIAKNNDTNNIPRAETRSVLNDKNYNYNKKHHKKVNVNNVINDLKNKTNKVDLIVILFTVIVAILLIICSSLIVSNKRLKRSTNLTNIMSNNKYKVLALSYSFNLPSGYSYYTLDNKVYISSDNTSIILYKYEEGRIDRVTGKALEEVYTNFGYTSVSSKESALSSHSIMYVNYSTGEMSYIDFYYQYKANVIIYGQINNKGGSINEEILSIIGSITLANNQTQSVGETGVNYQKVLNLFK